MDRKAKKFPDLLFLGIFTAYLGRKTKKISNDGKVEAYSESYAVKHLRWSFK